MIMYLKFVSMKSGLFGLKVIVGMRLEGHKQPLPNIKKNFFIRKKILFFIMLKGSIRMNDWKLKASKTFEINARMVFIYIYIYIYIFFFYFKYLNKN